MPEQSNVTGTDGVVPIVSTSTRWQIWSLSDLFMGDVGSNKFVPRVNDYAIDPPTNDTYIVVAINPTTLVPTLEPAPTPNSSLNSSDVLFGIFGRTNPNTYRAYLDTSVTPHSLTLDQRFSSKGNDASYAKIFLGSDLSGTGVVISQIFNNSGTLITDQVPLELVTLDNITNYSQKIISQCSCSISIIDGEVLTAVIYASNGRVIDKQQFLVENTDFIRGLNVSRKYITGVSLDTPFMSLTEPNVISIPVNVPLDSLNLRGIVNYSDGSSNTLPVDGTKFKLFGLEQFIASQVGQVFPLVLNYSLGVNEVGFGVSLNGTLSNDGKSINADYELKTTTTNNSYNVKLFGYPVWHANTSSYLIRWFLLNLDRNIVFDVTPYVVFSGNTGAFDGSLYGIVQTKNVTINLQDVDGVFNPYIYSQMVKITLLGAPSLGHTVEWLMQNDNTPGNISYGTDTLALINPGIGLTSSYIDISLGLEDQTTWLNKVYYSTYPLVNSTVESVAPVPTHFQILQGDLSTEFTIDQFSNTTLPLVTTSAVNDTIFIKFIKRTMSGDLILSVAAMLVGRY